MCFPSYSTHVSTTCWLSFTLLLIILFVYGNLPPKKQSSPGHFFESNPLHTHRYVLPRLFVEVRKCDLLELEEPDEKEREQKKVYLSGKFTECPGALMACRIPHSLKYRNIFLNCFMFFWCRFVFVSVPQAHTEVYWKVESRVHKHGWRLAVCFATWQSDMVTLTFDTEQRMTLLVTVVAIEVFFSSCRNRIHTKMPFILGHNMNFFFWDKEMRCRKWNIWRILRCPNGGRMLFCQQYEKLIYAASIRVKRRSNTCYILDINTSRRAPSTTKFPGKYVLKNSFLPI